MKYSNDLCQSVKGIGLITSYRRDYSAVVFIVSFIINDIIDGDLVIRVNPINNDLCVVEVE